MNLSPRTRWWILALAWVTLLVLGVNGFVQQSRELELERTFLDHVYFTLQLMTLDFRGGATAINWQLQIARFAAPVLAAGTLLQSASVVFREQFTRWRVRFRRGHTVLTGLGPAGTRMARALVADGRDVVAVDPDPASPGVAAVRELDVPVVVGDATDADVLQAARLDRAARLVAIGPDDAVNVAVAAAAGRVEREAGLAPLRCAVHLTDAELADLLRGAELGAERPVRLEFFNLHERAARVMIAEHPIRRDDPDDPTPPHLVVMGLGQVGRGVVVAAAQQWAEQGDGPLRVTLVDRAATGRLHALGLQHPALGEAVDARPIDMDLDAPRPDAASFLRDILRSDPPALVVVAFEDQALAWSAGLMARRLVGRHRADIVVRTESDGGLGVLLGETLADDDRLRIVTFPIFARSCTVATVEGGVREQVARAMHEDHVARSGTGAALHQHWDDLDDHDRESSRAAADSLVSRLATVGVELVPMRSWGVGDVPFTIGEIDELAAMEHQRWRAEREAAGWRWGEVRDDATKHNPLLVDWDQLDDVAKAYNRDAARAIPALVARAGYELARVRPEGFDQVTNQVTNA